MARSTNCALPSMGVDSKDTLLDNGDDDNGDDDDDDDANDADDDEDVE